MGIWLVFRGSFSSMTDNDDTEGMLDILGFIIFILALGGIIALFINQIPKGMTLEGGRRWKRIRANGKWIYVRNFVTWISIPVILVMSLPIFPPDYVAAIPFSEVLRNHLVFALVVIFVSFIAAIRFWNDKEEQYKALSSKLRLPPEKSSDHAVDLTEPDEQVSEAAK